MKRGRHKIEEDEKRRHAVSCRLTDAEAVACDARRGAVSRGEWLRSAAFGAPIPAQIPEVNRALWISLAPMSANLNQIARAINGGELANQIAELRITVAALRRVLIEGEGIDDTLTAPPQGEVSPQEMPASAPIAAPVPTQKPAPVRAWDGTI